MQLVPLWSLGHGAILQLVPKLFSADKSHSGRIDNCLRFESPLASVHCNRAYILAAHPSRKRRAMHARAIISFFLALPAA